MYSIYLNDVKMSRMLNLGKLKSCSLFIDRDLSYNQLTGEIPFNIGFLQVATLYVLGVFVCFVERLDLITLW